MSSGSDGSGRWPSRSRPDFGDGAGLEQDPEVEPESNLDVWATQFFGLPHSPDSGEAAPPVVDVPVADLPAANLPVVGLPVVDLPPPRGDFPTELLPTPAVAPLAPPILREPAQVSANSDSASAEVPEPTIELALLSRHPLRRWTLIGAALTPVLVALAATVGRAPTAGAMLLIVAVFAVGWPVLLELPDPRRASVVVGASGFLAVAAVSVTETEPRLRWLALALALSMMLSFGHQLVRRDGRQRLVESLAGEVCGSVILVSLASLAALAGTPANRIGVDIWAVAVASIMAAQWLPGSERRRAVIGLAVASVLAGLFSGLAQGVLLDGASRGAKPGLWIEGAVGGFAMAAIAVMIGQLLSALPAARSAPGWLAVAVAPAAASGAIGYVALRLLIG